MKIVLKKNFHFVSQSGKGVWKKGRILLNDRRVKRLKHPEGFVIRNFYSFGDHEIIPLSHLKIHSTLSELKQDRTKLEYKLRILNRRIQFEETKMI